MAELQILTEKVRDAVLADLTPEQDQVWARHIQFTNQEAAQQALDRLNKGEDFGALASELSEDLTSKGNAGDLGWLTRYDMVEQFGEAFAKSAFDELAIGAISQVVESGQGFHLIQVLGHEMRTLSPQEFDRLRQQEFQNWIEKQRANSDIQTDDIWVDQVPTEPDLSPSIRQFLQAASQPFQQSPN